MTTLHNPINNIIKYLVSLGNCIITEMLNGLQTPFNVDFTSRVQLGTAWIGSVEIFMLLLNHTRI